MRRNIKESIPMTHLSQWTGRLLGATLGFVIAAQAPAQAVKDEPKRPQIRVPEGVRAERDLAYVPGGASSQTLDLYVPNDASDPLPLVVWIHGGAWRAGSKDGCPAAPLAKRGFVVASINYRLSGEAVFPAQIEDCRAAIRWLRANAPKYHINPERVGVWGASAGGHLVALLGTSADVKGWDGVGGNTDQSARVQAVCDYYGPIDFLHNLNPERASKADSPVARLLGGPLKEKEQEAKQASPLTYISRDDPPFLIVHGDQDPAVPIGQSKLLLEALKKADIDVSFVPVKNGKHGGFNADCDPNPEQIRDTVFSFFDKHLKRAGSKTQDREPAK
jgi:acetyl esterase/lipase